MANMTDPAAAVKAIADKMQADVQESGLDQASQFVDKLNEIKESAKSGPGDIMDRVKGVMQEFKDKLDAAMADPGSLVPGGMAACASWYGNAIVEKLKSIAASFEELFNKIKAAAGDMAGPFKDMGKTMGDAMEGISSTVKGLQNLPKELLRIADNCTGAKDVKDIDTGNMKKSLDVGGMSEPLDKLGGLKESFGPLIGSVKSGVDSVTDFIQEAPDKIKDAFSVPSPLCFMTSCAMNQAPAIMTEMLDKVKALADFDFEPVLTMLKSAEENMANLDTSKVSDPVNKFAEMATGQVDKLDKVVQGAKMAGGGLPGGFKSPF